MRQLRGAAAFPIFVFPFLLTNPFSTFYISLKEDGPDPVSSPFSFSLMMSCCTKNNFKFYVIRQILRLSILSKFSTIITVPTGSTSKWILPVPADPAATPAVIWVPGLVCKLRSAPADAGGLHLTQSGSPPVPYIRFISLFRPHPFSLRGARPVPHNRTRFLVFGGTTRACAYAAGPLFFHPQFLWTAQPMTVAMTAPLSGLPVNGVFTPLDLYSVYTLSQSQSSSTSSARWPASTDLSVRR